MESGSHLRHLSALDDPNAVMVKTGLQLPTGLPEAMVVTGIHPGFSVDSEGVFLWVFQQ